MQKYKELGAHKAVRLVYLWLHMKISPKFSQAKYARAFDLHDSVASRNWRNDMPVMDKLFDKMLPGFNSLLGQLFAPTSGVSHVEMSITIDHEMGTVSFDRTVMKHYSDKKRTTLLSSAVMKGGSGSFTEG